MEIYWFVNAETKLKLVTFAFDDLLRLYNTKIEY